MREHPIDEWERLQSIPLPNSYDNRGNEWNGRFKFTKCSASFIYGDNDAQIRFQKLKNKVRVKFAEFLDVDEIRKAKEEGEYWGWLQAEMTNEEAAMFGRWLMEPNTWGIK